MRSEKFGGVQNFFLGGGHFPPPFFYPFWWYVKGKKKENNQGTKEWHYLLPNVRWQNCIFFSFSAWERLRKCKWWEAIYLLLSTRYIEESNNWYWLRTQHAINKIKTFFTCSQSFNQFPLFSQQCREHGMDKW